MNKGHQDHQGHHRGFTITLFPPVEELKASTEGTTSVEPPKPANGADHHPTLPSLSITDSPFNSVKSTSENAGNHKAGLKNLFVPPTPQVSQENNSQSPISKIGRDSKAKKFRDALLQSTPRSLQATPKSLNAPAEGKKSNTATPRVSLSISDNVLTYGEKVELVKQIFKLLDDLNLGNLPDELTPEDIEKCKDFVNFIEESEGKSKKALSDVTPLERCNGFLNWYKEVFQLDKEYVKAVDQVAEKYEETLDSQRPSFSVATPVNAGSNEAKKPTAPAAGDQNNSFKIAGHFTFGQAPTAITSFKSETFFAQAGSASVQVLGRGVHRNVEISPALQAKFDAEAKCEAAAIKAREEAAEKARLEKLAQQSKAEVKSEGAPASDPKNLDALSEAELLRKLKEKEQKLADVERQKQALLAQTSVQPKPKPCCEGCCTCDCTTAIAAFFGLRR